MSTSYGPFQISRDSKKPSVFVLYKAEGEKLHLVGAVKSDMTPIFSNEAMGDFTFGSAEVPSIMFYTAPGTQDVPISHNSCKLFAHWEIFDRPVAMGKLQTRKVIEIKVPQTITREEAAGSAVAVSLKDQLAYVPAGLVVLGEINEYGFYPKVSLLDERIAPDVWLYMHRQVAITQQGVEETATLNFLPGHGISANVKMAIANSLGLNPTRDSEGYVMCQINDNAALHRLADWLKKWGLSWYAVQHAASTEEDSVTILLALEKGRNEDGLNLVGHAGRWVLLPDKYLNPSDVATVAGISSNNVQELNAALTGRIVVAKICHPNENARFLVWRPVRLFNEETLSAKVHSLTLPMVAIIAG
jgi:hypothetical protein